MTHTLPAFLDESSEIAARELLGCILVREIDGRMVRCRIVETEAYSQTDAASHSYRGETPRTKPMFGASGHAYVYFTYGMHYCMNVVVGPEGHGAAVLVRAVEPIDGVEVIERRRPNTGGVGLTNGPAKLCQALGIDRDLSGHDLRLPPLRLEQGERVPDKNIVRTTRIGISQAKEELLRFYVRDSPYVSRR